MQCRRPIVWFHVPRAIALIVVIAACRADPPTVAPGDRMPHAIDAFSGNMQIGEPGMPLQEPIAARVVDDAGAPVANAQVSWSADDGGAITAGTISTDAHGIARAAWADGTPGSRGDAGGLARRKRVSRHHTVSERQRELRESIDLFEQR